jgi:DNA polymerase (family 10)
MDLADDCLAELDIVIASVHSAFNQDAEQMTDRLLRAIACPWVDVLGHPTGRLILKRDAYRFDAERVFTAAAAPGCWRSAVNHRLDLDEIPPGRPTRQRRVRDRLRRLHRRAGCSSLEVAVAPCGCSRTTC